MIIIIVISKKSPKYVKGLNQKIRELHGLVGSTFYSNNCGKFTVLEYCGRGNTNSLYKIKFLNTGKKYISNITNILTGEVKDKFSPTISGISYSGDYARELMKNDRPLYDALRLKHYGLVRRCYNKNDRSYDNYGKLGVRMCDEWHNFSSFAKDIMSLDDFDRDGIISGELFLDKDKKQFNIPMCDRIYSKETVSLITRLENNKYRDNTRMGEKHSKYFIYIHSDGTETVEKNPARFSRVHNISLSTIHHILYGDKKNRQDIWFRKPTPDELKRIESGELYEGKIIN